MAFKQFLLDDNTVVTIYKRKSSKSLRLSVNAKGEVKVSIPTWAPYSHGVNFAKSRHGWIEKQKVTIDFIADGQAIGKAHHLVFVPDASITKPSSRIKTNEIIITYPVSDAVESPSVQAAAERASIRALRAQAEQLLPKRLRTLADQYGFEFKSVSVKQLKSRWGSCDQHKNIVLNLYLMQLPWNLIDYVLLHELTHTRILRHGPDFWSEMSRVLPNAKQLRKAMRGHQPVLNG